MAHPTSQPATTLAAAPSTSPSAPRTPASSISNTAHLPSPPLPLPISLLAGHYYIYSVPALAYIRSAHSIPGLPTGTLPQSPQQNLFFGLPTQLLPEEARLLCERGVAFLVDDAAAHRDGLTWLRDNPDGTATQAQFAAWLRDLGARMADANEERARLEKIAALRRLEDDGGEKAARARRKKEERERERARVAAERARAAGAEAGVADESVLHDAQAATEPPRAGTLASTSAPRRETYTFTPTTSHPPFPVPAPPSLQPSADPSSSSTATISSSSYTVTSALPPVPPSYPLYRHLHAAGYFLTRGLRFGCQYTAYPGDPLRFHSHFLCVGRRWDEEMELLSLVGGGRLGTGVKKGYLIGGVERNGDVAQVQEGRGDGSGGDMEEGKVRCFSIEWGGM